MLTEPRDLDRSELKHVLQAGWGLRDPQLDYLAVGFGGHHWRAIDARGTRRFITVDDLEASFRRVRDADSAFAALDRAFRAACALRDKAKLEFVLSPLVDAQGGVVRRINERYAITVLPLSDGEASEYGPYEAPEDRRLMGRVLGRLHSATGHVPMNLPATEDFEVPSRAALVEALGDVDRSWDFGPFAEPARRLLQRTAPQLHRRLRDYDDVAGDARQTADRWVITHGEPHRGNVIREGDGGFYLVDWDTTLIAPRERDLHMVLDEDLTGWREYTDASGVAGLNHDTLRLYQLWWHLADVSTLVRDFRRPHVRTKDTLACWANLVSNLEPYQSLA
jgi:spectinomycin phosphotransferase